MIVEGVRRLWAVTPDEQLAPVAAADVEAELSRRSLLWLPFAPAIEARYDADTRADRAWNIRLTVPMGLVAYNAFTLVDPTMLPDLALVPMMLRIGLITPVGLFAMWMCSRVSAAFREAFISLAITVTMLIPVGFMIASRAPFAPYTTLVVLLVSMFGNIVMRVRFHWACFFSVMTIVSVGLMLFVRVDLPAPLSIHLLIAMVTGVSFGIVANNQLERSERRSFLLSLRETIRAHQLIRDKEAFSALSLVDPLTKLANRRAFDAKLGELWQHWTQLGQTFSLLMIDVDHFKRFNDYYGHQGGDKCLERVAIALKDVVIRPSDLVTRYGGEEFAVLLADCGTADAIMIAEKLRRNIRAAAIVHENCGNGDRLLSVTIGVASMDGGCISTAAGLVAQADHNLYVAKRDGRNRICPAFAEELKRRSA